MTVTTTAPATPAVLPVGGDSDLPHIIIVGGGAGGLELATRLGERLGRDRWWRKKQAKVSLIEKSRTHIWKPLLHEIAAGSMDTAQHELEYQAQGYWHGFQFRYGEMTGIDRKKQLVYLAATYDEEGAQITPVRSFRYDILVIAVGCVGNDFGTPGVKEYAIMLDTPEQAERFNRRLDQRLRARLCAARADPAGTARRRDHRCRRNRNRARRRAASDGARRRRLRSRQDRSREGHQDFADRGGAAHPAGAARAHLRRRSPKRWASLKVEIRTGSPVTAVTAEGVKLANGGFIPSELVVWAAGVKGPDVLASSTAWRSAAPTSSSSRTTLQTTRDPNIFALGDCAYWCRKGRRCRSRRARRPRTRRLRTSTRDRSAS